MFRAYQELFRRLFIAGDAVIVIASFLMAWWLKFDSGWIAHAGHLPLLYYRGPLLIAVIVFVLANSVARLYEPMRAKSLFYEAYSVAKGVILGTIVLMAALYFAKMQEFSRDVIALFAGINFALMVGERIVVRSVLRSLRRRGLNQRFLLIVGWSPATRRFLDALESQPWFGYRVIGHLRYEGDDASSALVPCIGMVADIRRVLEEHLVDQVVIAAPRERVGDLADVISACEAVGVQSLILPDYFDLLPARPRFETFGDVPLIDTRHVPLDDAMNAFLKRAFDIAFSLMVLIGLSPLFLAIAIAVKLSSPGPVLYVQERVGKNRRTFKMYKFRTMYWDSSANRAEQDCAEEADLRSAGWTVKGDPRRTRVGAFLRRTSLDELPQFWNVLKGDMSVIGPRPERPVFVERFREEVPRYMVKHRVRPGITGWAQVHGWRGDTSIAERIRLDIEYIENWSFWLDLKIVWKTIKDGLVNENAY